MIPLRGPVARLLAVLALLGCAGCSAGDEQPVAEENRPESDRVLSGRVAQLSIVSRDPLGRADVPLSATAQFVEFSGVDVRTVRRSLDLWLPDNGIEEETCYILEDPAPIDARSWYSSHIELLHAGTLVIETPTRQIELLPRPIPEVLPYLSGFTYGTDSRARPAYEPGLAVDVWSAGGHQVGGFDVSLTMPDPIAISYVGGVAVGSAEAVDISLDGDLLLLWEPSMGGDVITIILEEDGVERRRTVSCVAVDDGAFQLSGAALEALDSGSPRTPIRITLRRAERQPLELGGFDAADAVAVTEHSVLVY